MGYGCVRESCSLNVDVWSGELLAQALLFRTSSRNSTRGISCLLLVLYGKARNSPSKGLLVPWAGSLWHNSAGGPMRAKHCWSSTNESGEDWLLPGKDYRNCRQAPSACQELSSEKTLSLNIPRTLWMLGSNPWGDYKLSDWGRELDENPELSFVWFYHEVCREKLRRSSLCRLRPISPGDPWAKSDHYFLSEGPGLTSRWWCC